LAADLSRMSIGIGHVTKELGLLEAARASVVHARHHTRGAPTLNEIGTLLTNAGLDSARLSVFSEESSPYSAIEHVANRTGSDLVVVGTSRFPVFKRLFGSVSNEVLRGIKHDVLVISPVAARRAHRRAWVASRRAALPLEHERIQCRRRLLEACDVMQVGRSDSDETNSRASRRISLFDPCARACGSKAARV
jgi:nucleotide-binding universal stress UspA family protein